MVAVETEEGCQSGAGIGFGREGYGQCVGGIDTLQLQ